MNRFALVILTALATLIAKGQERARDERGDVPGWVLITLMSAGLVAALWLLAEDALTNLFTTAMDTVLSR